MNFCLSKTKQRIGSTTFATGSTRRASTEEEMSSVEATLVGFVRQ
ncbi:hypothetical protein BZL29_0229 [Mycobacterium kansasii]|uniref:Uncharacterized protein n=1 Tax=Mycobacterium kansasii TaxID=1768 RepID=A0A1V3XYK8_MYCKA|nr:hypothetical protein BZL29_0229 [Mycobacterium kansasii]